MSAPVRLVLEAGALGLALLYCRRGFFAVTVVGNSMAPEIVDGDCVLAWRLVHGREWRRGDVAVFAHPDGIQGSIDGDKYLIKSVACAPGDVIPETLRGLVSWTTNTRMASGWLILQGVASKSSSHGYLVPTNVILARVLWRAKSLD